MDNRKKKILLYGTGAVGGFYAGKLSQAGASVSVVSRSDYDIVKRNGIMVKSVLGDFHFMPDRVLKSGAEYNDSADYIIVATKALPEIDVSAMIKDSVKPESSIVLLQNGIDIEKDLLDRFPENEVISALAFICVSRSEYGLVDHQDYGRIVVGRYPGGASDNAAALESLFTKAGLPAEYTDDVIMARWRKLLWNAPFNPLSVICGGADTREMLQSREVRELCIEVMREVVKLSRADGHPLSEEMITKNVEDTERMTPYKTSMLLDYEHKRPMEVDAILGNAVKIADRYGVEAVHLKTLYALLKIINQKNLVCI